MKPLIRDISVAAIMAAGLSILPGCDGKPNQTTASSAAPAEPPAAIAAVSDKQEPQTPQHFYSMAEDGEYGYERAMSDDDIKAGRATAALLMVRYLGEKNGTRSVKVVDGDVANVISCSAPCKFVKSKTFFAGRLVKIETVPVTGGSLVQAVMSDVFGDQLVVFGQKAS